MRLMRKGGDDGKGKGKGRDDGKGKGRDRAGSGGKGGFDDRGKGGKGDDRGKGGKGDDRGKGGKGDDRGKGGKGDDRGKGGKSKKGNKAPEKPTMPLEQVRSKIGSLLKEYLSIVDIDEAVACLHELPKDKGPQELAMLAIANSLECKVSDRENYVKLLVELFENKEMLSVSNIEHAIEEQLEMIEDMVMDVPRIHENMGCVCGHLLLSDCFTMQSFHATCAKFNLLESGMGGKIVAEMLKEMSKSAGSGGSGGRAARDKVPLHVLTRFMKPAEQNSEAVAAFVQEKGLVDIFPSLTVQKMLGGGSSAEEVLGWIKGSVSDAAIKDGSFARQVFVDVLKTDPADKMPEGGKAELLTYVVAKTEFDNQSKILFGIQEYCNGINKCATGKSALATVLEIVLTPFPSLPLSPSLLPAFLHCQGHRF
jgi:hypothetical protein